MQPHRQPPLSSTLNPYWSTGPNSSGYGAADRVLNWRNTTRAPLSPISTNLNQSSYSLEPFPQQHQKFGSSTSSSRGWAPLKPYHRPSSNLAPTLAPGEPAPPSLNSLPSLELSNSTILNRSTRCSSCGTHLPNVGDIQNPVQLVPCRHPICSTCLTLLINSAANVPPRPVDCFACGETVEAFAGFTFAPGVVARESRRLRSGQVTPSKRGRQDENEGLSSEPLSSGSHFGLANFRLDDIRLGGHSPSTTPNGKRGSGASGEIDPPQAYSVVRIDNIPWSLTTSQVFDWLPPDSLPASAAHPIHILINRQNFHTLNQAYVELASPEQAKKLVRANLKGGRIADRPIGVALSSQQELLENVFPGWAPGFRRVDALEPSYEGVLITPIELNSLSEQFSLTSVWARRAPERMFLQLATIVAKLPWHQPETYTPKLVAKLFATVEVAVGILTSGEDGWFDARDEVLMDLMRVVLDCPGFRHAQKSVLWKLSGIRDFESPMRSDGSSGAGFGSKDPLARHTESAPAKLGRGSSQGSSVGEAKQARRGRTA